jgi:hypothetical protein
MSPLWPTYYEDCHMVVFVIDASDAASIAPATVELCELMQHPKLQVRFRDCIVAWDRAAVRLSTQLPAPSNPV